MRIFFYIISLLLIVDIALSQPATVKFQITDDGTELDVGTAVKLNGASTLQSCGSNDPDVIGVITAKENNGITRYYVVSSSDVAFSRLAATVTAGEELTTDAGGRLRDASAGEVVVGIALDNGDGSDLTLEKVILQLDFTSSGLSYWLASGTDIYNSNTGNVCIGTATSYQKLTIGGAAKQAISRDVANSALEIMGGQSEATGAYFQITGNTNVGSPYRSSAEFVIGNIPDPNGSQFAFFSYDGAATWTQLFRLEGATGNTFWAMNMGNVAVGTVNVPTYLLDVDGTIRTGMDGTDGQLIIYSEQGAPDYSTTINPPAAMTADVPYYLPTAQGAARTVLRNDGAGNLSWVEPIPEVVTFFAQQANYQWTNMPAALTEIFALANRRTQMVLTNATQARVTVTIMAAGSANAEIRAQYSTDLVTWFYLDGVSGPGANISAVGVRVSGWVNLAAGAQADVYLRLIGINGSGVADPQFGLITLQVR